MIGFLRKVTIQICSDGFISHSSYGKKRNNQKKRKLKAAYILQPEFQRTKIFESDGLVLMLKEWSVPTADTYKISNIITITLNAIL